MRHNLYEGALKAYDKASEINHVHAHSWYDKSLLLACWSDIITKKIIFKQSNFIVVGGKIC
jgi:hypothetical protein